MLTDWDKDYYFSEGDEDASNPKHKSVLDLRVYAGLDTIVEECGHSDFDSSQDISFNEEKMTEMQYGSSILLDFDYSLRTIDEQSSEVSFEKPSECSSSSVDELAATRVGLDSISGHFENSRSLSTIEEEPVTEVSQIVEMALHGGASGWSNSEYSGEHSLAAISEPSNDILRRETSDSSNGAESMTKESSAGEKSAQKGSSTLMNSKDLNQSTTLESISRSGETFEDELYESDSSTEFISSNEGSKSESESEYSTENESSSKASEESSNISTSGTPLSSVPHSAETRNVSNPRQNSISGAFQGQDDSLSREKVMSKEKHDAMAHSKEWTAIAEENKADVSIEVKDATDAAVWGIARSLSAIRRSLSGLRDASVASSLSSALSVLKRSN
jgi:hypothetical protein